MEDYILQAMANFMIIYPSFHLFQICDNDMRIMDVTAYPGTVHDQFIWSYSNAKVVMRTAHDMQMGKFYLIGKLITFDICHW